jgi:hypothetical protein
VQLLRELRTESQRRAAVRHPIRRHLVTPQQCCSARTAPQLAAAPCQRAA